MTPDPSAANASAVPPDRGEFQFDGKSVPFEPTDALGVVGNRLLLRPAGGDTVHLVRRVVWFTPDGWQFPIKAYRAEDAGMAYMFRRPPDEQWSVPIHLRNAQEVSPGSADQIRVSLFEQDVSRLESLPSRVEALVRKGGRAELADAHRLFASACKALSDYADRVNPEFVPAKTEQARDQPRPGVPLLAPAGFAAGPGNEVVLLDVGFVLPHHDGLRALAPPAYKSAFPHTQYTFGLRCNHAHFDPLHALAVILFFRQTLETARQGGSAEAIKVLEDTDGKIQAAQTAAKMKNGNPTLEELQSLFGGLGQLQQAFRRQADRVDGAPVIPVGAKPPRAAEPMGGTKPVSVPGPINAAPPGWPKSAKVTAGVLGTTTLALLGLAAWLATRAPASQPPAPASGEPRPEYFVMFPSQSVSPEQIQASLAESFGDAPPQVIQADAAKRQQLLDERLQQIVGKLTDPAKARDLLTKLTSANVKFLGFDPEERDAAVSLKRMIDREGVFLPGGAPGSPAVPGILLQPDAKARLLGIAGLAADPEAGKLLDELQAAVRDQTTYRELLNAIGDRAAVVVDGGKAPEARAKLLARSGPPVFAPRPGIAMYSAVDPKFETISVTGDNSLSVPVPSHWRLVGERDRQGATFEGVSDAVRGQLLWASVPANQRITWQSAGLERDGQTVPVASFDVAIPLPAQGKVVVFRNQILYSDQTRESVQTKVRTYLTRRLKLPADQIPTAFDVTGQSGRYVGTILYSALAQAMASGPPLGSADVAVLPVAEFAKLVETENAAVPKPEGGDPKPADPKPPGQ
jgi:hypothetical protein